MTPSMKETRAGTYKEPFTQTQYGVFATDSKTGEMKFITATVAGEEHALLRARNYYFDMKPTNPDLDMGEMDTFVVKTRTLTHGLWEDES